MKTKSTAKKQKGPAATTSRRRRGAQTQGDSSDSTNNEQAFQPNNPRNFVSRNAREVYGKLATRNVIYGFSVVLEDICRGGLRVKGMLDAMGWTKLLTRKVKVYLKLIKIFYANLSAMDEDGVLRTTVLKKNIEFDAETINYLLHLPNEGAEELNAFTKGLRKKL
ncbi:hypothetical protein SLA2020_092820 [Shorea laevis]